MADYRLGIWHHRPGSSRKAQLRKLKKIWSPAPQMVPGREQPEVSVVVCAYNAADTLEECLASLTKLNYRDCESSWSTMARPIGRRPSQPAIPRLNISANPISA